MKISIKLLYIFIEGRMYHYIQIQYKILLEIYYIVNITYEIYNTSIIIIIIIRKITCLYI